MDSHLTQHETNPSKIHSHSSFDSQGLNTAQLPFLPDHRTCLPQRVPAAGTTYCPAAQHKVCRTCEHLEGHAEWKKSVPRPSDQKNIDGGEE